VSDPLYISSGKTVRIRPDFSEHPVKIPLPRDRRLAVIVLAFVCIWGAIGTIGTFGIPAVLAQNTQGIVRLWPYMLALVMTITVLYFGWTAMRLYVSNDTITIDNGQVCFTRVELFSKSSWCEPIAAYQGVRNREISTKVNNKAVTYQVVEIIHPANGKTLPVFIDKGASLPAHILSDLATSLGLPVLKKDSHSPEQPC
jgi:hypothetical protein